MVQLAYNDAIIKKRLGWSPTSTMIVRYTHLNDEDVINATLSNTGKIPKTAVRTEIKEAEKLSLVDAAMQLSKLSEENRELKQEVEIMKASISEDMIKAMINARVNELMKKNPEKNDA
jgi:hypothetical protein